MKDAEDEAFDDLARRQGSWGGGYRAKRAAAADKLKAEDDDIQVYKREWVGLTEGEIDGYLDWDDWQVGTDRSTILGMVRDIEAKLRSKNNGP